MCVTRTPSPGVSRASFLSERPVCLRLPFPASGVPRLVAPSSVFKANAVHLPDASCVDVSPSLTTAGGCCSASEGLCHEVGPTRILSASQGEAHSHLQSPCLLDSPSLISSPLEPLQPGERVAGLRTRPGSSKARCHPHPDWHDSVLGSHISMGTAVSALSEYGLSGRAHPGAHETRSFLLGVQLTQLSP